MNKAIYIFNEPKNCHECPFNEWVQEEFCAENVCMAKRIVLGYVYSSEDGVSRPSWCPLIIFKGSESRGRKMSYLEVLSEIQRVKTDSFRVVADCVRRSIPREVKYDVIPGKWVCPSCEQSVKKTDLYCRRCGQALKEQEKSYE